MQKKSKTFKISIERQIKVFFGSIIFAGYLLGEMEVEKFFHLCGFCGAGLVFSGLLNWCATGLLLSKAPWNKR
jgi:hypothetical protein